MGRRATNPPGDVRSNDAHKTNRPAESGHDACHQAGRSHCAKADPADIRPGKGGKILSEENQVEPAAIGKSHQHAGKRRYLSPEVLAGKDADSRTDIWAVGTVLSELTSRHRRVLRKCCAPDPSRRYQHIRELKEALEARQRPGIIALAVACALGLALLILPPLFPSLRPVLPPFLRPALLPLLRPVATPASSTTDTILIQHKDTVFIQQAPARPGVSGDTSSPGPAAGSPANSPAVSSSATREDIDHLFQEATELFQ